MKQLEAGTVDYEIANSQQTGIKPRLLLHACCGPCTAGALANIAPYFDITIYFYNPNIMPKEEFNKRILALKDVISHFDNVKLVIPKQDESDFLPLVKGMEALPEGGKRCSICFAMRLKNTAEYLAAHKGEFDFFATTLTISPMKNAALINEIGNSVAKTLGVNYLSSNFKKHDGFLKSTTLCKQWDIYRQHYCGCTLRVL